MRPRSYCLVKSTHMTADCRQVADACISEARLHAPVDVALHVNFGDEVLWKNKGPMSRLSLVWLYRDDLKCDLSGVFLTAVLLIRQPYLQEVDVYQRQVTLH